MLAKHKARRGREKAAVRIAWELQLSTHHFKRLDTAPLPVIRSIATRLVVSPCHGMMTSAKRFDGPMKRSNAGLTNFVYCSITPAWHARQV
eukprot:366092-Chlamydomonas_euryale.AAC.6